MTVVINKVATHEGIEKCLEIRRHVFIIGQKVPVNEEIDGKDNDSIHYLLSINEKPAGTARVRIITDYAKIERVAILDEYQGTGLGYKIMSFIITDLKLNPKVAQLKLSSQTHAIAFYKKLGFSVCSEEYMDANIPHKDMYMLAR
ncbi:MAG: GNAT family N-acetyltransferase [Legionella sp.]|jgi:predicted GNAT family N-acyltransferase